MVTILMRPRGWHPAAACRDCVDTASVRPVSAGEGPQASPPCCPCLEDGGTCHQEACTQRANIPGRFRQRGPAVIALPSSSRVLLSVRQHAHRATTSAGTVSTARGGEPPSPRHLPSNDRRR